MASGDKTKLKTFNGPIVASYAGAGTYCWVIMKNGRVSRYTLAGGAVAAQSLIHGDVKCIYTDNTTIYLGMGDGRLMSYTTATKANSVLARFDCAITSMSVSGGKIYCGLANGKLYSYEI